MPRDEGAKARAPGLLSVWPWELAQEEPAFATSEASSAKPARALVMTENVRVPDTTEGE